MLYVSHKINDNAVEITDTTTNKVIREPINTLYRKYHDKVIEGVTYSPKRKHPHIEVTTPALLMLDRLPVGQTILVKRLPFDGENRTPLGFEHCLKIGQNKEGYKFYTGGGRLGFMVLTKRTLIGYKDHFVFDVTHVDDNVANLLKQEYKEYLHNK